MTDCVVGLIRKHSLILGVSRKDNHNDFGLPGGKVEDGETLLDALTREVKEETGLDVYSAALVFSQDSTYAFEVTVLSGEPHTKEAGKVAWITWQDLFDGSFGAYNKALKEFVR